MSNLPQFVEGISKKVAGIDAVHFKVSISRYRYVEQGLHRLPSVVYFIGLWAM
jgi:hypothetical protein